MTSIRRLPLTASSSKLPGLDHLRALAIILVFVYHYGIFGHPEWIQTIGSFGWSGVDLFFVLSGYLIGRQLLREVGKTGAIDVKEFYLKRLLRIIPAYAVVLACYFLIPGFREKPTIAPFWKFATFTQNFGLDLSTQRSFSHAWSLCIEEQFYLILPLVLLFMITGKSFKHGWWLLALLFVAGLAFRTYSMNTWVAAAADTDRYDWVWYTFIYYPTYNRLDGLLAGIAIAAAMEFWPRFKSYAFRHANIILAGGFAILVAAWFFCEDQISFHASVFGFPLIALGYGLLVLAGLSPNCILLKTPLNITAFIARISYSVYLSHKACIHLTQQALSNWGISEDSNLTLLICVLTSLAGGCLLHYSIEQPFLRLRDRLAASNKKHALTNVRDMLFDDPVTPPK